VKVNKIANNISAVDINPQEHEKDSCKIDFAFDSF
jgi:hypothetical protein